MPWVPSDAKRHCKDCPPSKWASIANAVLKNCRSKGGTDCEGRAVRIANSRSKLEDISVEAMIELALADLEKEKDEGGEWNLNFIKIDPDEVKLIIESDKDADDELKEELLNDLIDEEEVEEDVLEELEIYAELQALPVWKAPGKRKDVPSSHFFWPEQKKYPYRNSDGSINCGGVLAAWRMANGARSGKKAPSDVIARIRPKRDACLGGGSDKKKKKKRQEDPAFDHSEYTLTVASDQPVVFETKDGKKMSTIQMLRMGVFDHPMWGKLNFDSKIFSNFTRNFNKGIPQSDIAIDFKHMPEWGAAAWVSKMHSKGNSFLFDVEWTPRGQKAVEDEEFKFTSIEFTEQYKDAETGKLHGPTVLGGGLTNRPFIKGMAPLAMSEDGNTLLEFKAVGAAEDDSYYEGGVNMKTLEEVKAAIDAITSQIAELSEKVTKDPDNKELVEEVKGLTAKLAEANDALKDFKVEDNDEERKQELEELKTTNTKLSGDVETLTNTVKSLLEERKTEKRAFYVSQVEKKCDEFKGMGVPPAMIEVVKPLLLTDDASRVEITLEDSEGKEDKITLTNAVEKIFESLPDSAKVDLSEKTQIDKAAGDISSKLDVADVEKFAKENEMSFSDAIIELQKQGKIAVD